MPRSPSRLRVPVLLVATSMLAAVAGVVENHGRAAAGVTVSPEPLYEDRFVDAVDYDGFLRGNLHAHSSWSDGDVSPEDLVRWYRRNGYQFAALTDHNFRVDPAILAHLERPDFLLVPGEEITMMVYGKPIHVNGLCTDRTIGAPSVRPASREEALRYAIDAVEAQNGVALINHPNFGWALGPEQLAPFGHVPLLEIASGHPNVHDDGDDHRPSAEDLWTGMLDAGSNVAAVAVDDAHVFVPRTMKDPQARPGTGWVGVYGTPLERDALCDALLRGELFASTGPTIPRLRVLDDTITVGVDDDVARVEFVGRGGEVLSTRSPDAEGTAHYALEGGESYVRVRVTDGSGHQAFTRAFRVETVEIKPD